MSFAKNIGRNNGEDISKNLSSKYGQKLIDHAKQSAYDALKTASKKVIQKTAEATGDLIVEKFLIKLQEPQKLHQRVIQKQIKNKYLEIDLYFQN